jgi:hypothetical protein
VAKTNVESIKRHKAEKPTIHLSVTVKLTVGFSTYRSFDQANNTIQQNNTELINKSPNDLCIALDP